MLDAARLVTKLRGFCDPDFASFRGFPTTRDQARQEWAAAFADYFNQVQEDISPPVSGHPALGTGSVESSFFGDLGLDPSVSAEDTATDFAGAWQQGVLAVTPGTPAVDSSGNSYTFLSWNNVSTLKSTLFNTLKALFESPSAASVARLTEIADAFHTASSGLEAAVTIANSSGATSPGTMGVL